MFKFLHPDGCTYHDGKQFIYDLPGPGQKWARTDHPTPGKPDGMACGPGGLHAMKGLDASYAPPLGWWPWWCREVGVRLGADETKIRNTALELRRISPRTLARCLRPPFNWGRRANLDGADLRGADLRGADLRWANLDGARWDKRTVWPDDFIPSEKP
jgi:hypothetical protein